MNLPIYNGTTFSSFFTNQNLTSVLSKNELRHYLPLDGILKIPYYPLVTTRAIPYLHQISSIFQRSPSELLSVSLNNLLLVIDILCTRYKNVFNKRFQSNVCQNNSAKIYYEKSNEGM